MLYFSKFPSNKEENDMNILILNKYKIYASNIQIFECATIIFIKDINDIGIKEILTNIESNQKINKIKNLYFKSDKNFKNLFISDYLKESFFKKNINFIKFYISSKKENI